MKRLLSQEEIDALFTGAASTSGSAAGSVVPFDFSRLDRIPKSQLRAVHLLHETFVRNLATSLAAYLRTHVSPNLVSLEQISYGEFLEGLESPTCLAYVGLRPFDGTMLVELSRSLVFSSVELLLGGGSGNDENPPRKLTDIERSLVQNLMRVLLGDFREAWRSVADIQFEVQQVTDQPHGLRVLTSAEAVVAVSIEVKAGSASGMVNMAIPSLFIKTLRDKFDRLQGVNPLEQRRADQLRMAALLKPVGLDVEVRVDGGVVAADDLADIEVGEILAFDVPCNRPVTAHINGHPMYLGSMDVDRDRLRFTIEKHREAE